MSNGELPGETPMPHGSQQSADAAAMLLLNAVAICQDISSPKLSSVWSGCQEINKLSSADPKLSLLGPLLCGELSGTIPKR